jgi:hypothetical protein
MEPWECPGAGIPARDFAPDFSGRIRSGGPSEAIVLCRNSNETSDSRSWPGRPRLSASREGGSRRPGSITHSRAGWRCTSARTPGAS